MIPDNTAPKPRRRLKSIGLFAGSWAATLVIATIVGVFLAFVTIATLDPAIMQESDLYDQIAGARVMIRFGALWTVLMLGFIAIWYLLIRPKKQAFFKYMRWALVTGSIITFLAGCSLLVMGFEVDEVSDAGCKSTSTAIIDARSAATFIDAQDGWGTGYYATSDGKIVTAAHVVENAPALVTYDEDLKPIPLQVLKVDA